MDKALTFIDIFILDLHRNEAHFFNSVLITCWLVSDYTSRCLPTIHCPSFAQLFSSKPSPCQHLCRFKAFRITCTLQNMQEQNDVSDNIERSQNTPHQQYKIQNPDSISLGRPIKFRDCYETVQSESVFFKAGKREQEITLIFTFFLVCWFHKMLK